MVSSPHRRLVYLHGFASSPGSNKARRFAEALLARGVEADLPNLNQGDFTGLTVSRQISLLDSLTAGQGPASVVLIGSSMGAYVSALFATIDGLARRVAALVLMAPAFGFIRRWTGRMSPEALDLWRERGSMQVFHHATEQWQPIGWGLVEDASRHPDYPDVRVPTLVIHGRMDESVPVECSQHFARARENVVLELIDSDHSLAGSVDWIIDRAFQFLAPWFPELQTEGEGAGKAP